MNITVYCGANPGRDPEFIRRAAELGTWIGQNGHRLVYGAGKDGMMGALSNAVLEAGGEVIGVTPDFFIIAEETHGELTELRITADLPERRQMMIDEGDAFIALPGGTGTLDEIGEKRRPVMLYNINGYYDDLFRFLDRMADEEFHRQVDRENILEVCSLEDIERVLSTAGEPVPERNKLYDQ